MNPIYGAFQFYGWNSVAYILLSSTVKVKSCALFQRKICPIIDSTWHYYCCCKLFDWKTPHLKSNSTQRNEIIIRKWLKAAPLFGSPAPPHNQSCWRLTDIKGNYNFSKCLAYHNRTLAMVVWIRTHNILIMKFCSFVLSVWRVNPGPPMLVL